MQHDILWEPTPSQAHWQTGKVERVVGLLTSTMTNMAREHTDMRNEEFFSWAMVAHNEQARENGWSPGQTILGRERRPLDPDLVPLGVIQVVPDTVNASLMEKGTQRRLLSRTAYLEAQAERRKIIARLSAIRQTQSGPGATLTALEAAKHSRSPQPHKGEFSWSSNRSRSRSTPNRRWSSFPTQGLDHP